MSNEHFEVKSFYHFERVLNQSKDKLKCTLSTPMPKRCTFIELGRATTAITIQTRKSPQEIGDLFVRIAPPLTNKTHNNINPSYSLITYTYQTKEYKQLLGGKVDVYTGLYDPLNTNTIFYGDLHNDAVIAIMSDDFLKDVTGRILQGSIDIYTFKEEKNNVKKIYQKIVDGEMDGELTNAKAIAKNDNFVLGKVYQCREYYLQKLKDIRQPNHNKSPKGTIRHPKD